MTTDSASGGHGVLSKMAFGRRKVWWAVGGGVVVLLIASIAVTVPGRHSSVLQMSGVTSATSADSTTSTAAAGTVEQGPAVHGPSQGGYAADAAASQPSSIGSVGQQRLVIETANLDLTVSQLSKVTSHISSLAAESGGFVQSMNQSTDSQGQNSATLTVRIPENRFQTVLQDVKSLGKVNAFSQTGQDVTNEHDNLQLQITELQSEAKAYTRLFDKAIKMSDMLQIQQRLTQTNNQIANLNNQLHQLDHTIQYATISITLQPSVVPIHHGSEPVWAPFVQSLHFMDRVGIVLSKVVGWLLPWAVLGGLVYGGVRIWRRGKVHKA